MKKVVLLQRVLPHYRVSFVRALRNRLWSVGIELILVYGQEERGTVPQTARIEESWAHYITNFYANLPGVTCVFQSIGLLLRNADLVIVEPANQLILNYWLLATRRLTNRKVAFFGHGRNYQARVRGGIRERLREIMLRQADWWFAYAQAGKRLIVDAGFPETLVTVVNNTIDTELLADALLGVKEGQLTSLRSQLGLRGANVGIFCGGMYPAKRLDFLLQACVRIRTIVPDFEMVLVGDGPSQHLASAAADNFSWIHYVGSKTKGDLAVIYRLGKVLLVPGVIGLVIIDSFVGQLPLFTTNSSAHGPEIEYLQQGMNGVSVEQDVELYSNAVAEYLISDAKLRRLIEGCKASAQEFSLDLMVANFTAGIEQCLTTSETAKHGRSFRT